jgi:uncharacterized membrane-anchored protein YitT (DUF2179 family)
MLKHLRLFFIINLGACMDAAGFYYFLAPNQIAPGGINGLALVIKQYFPSMPLGLLVLIMSLILLLLGTLTIGTVFGTQTVYCSLAIPLMIWVMEHYFPIYNPLSTDVLIQLIFGVLISGTGIAILLNQNASTGGTDVLARILYKYHHIDMGKGLLLIDFFITIAAVNVFGLEKGMYAILGILLYGFIIDYVIEGLNVSNHVTIITTNSTIIKDFIINELGRGATLYMARGAFTATEKEVVVTIMNRREFIRLKNFIKENAPQSFVSVQKIHEVTGEGFSSLE